MAEPFVGQVIAVGFNFAPVGWYLCNGQTIPISQNEVLFNLLGTTYGGNGTSTFALPDLRGRSPLSIGQGNGLSNYSLGQPGGTESVTLTSNQIGSHTHSLQASGQTGTVSIPASNTAIATVSESQVSVFAAPPGNTTMAPSAISPSGSSLPHENRQPFQTVNYIIAAFGLYPSQG